jgi:hypothetical protein
MCLFVEDSSIVLWIKFNVDGTMLFEDEVHGEPKNDEKMWSILTSIIF